MHYIPYNSRAKYHKNPFGAIEAGTKVNFRVILPRDIRCTGIRLVCYMDGQEAQYISMDWERMEGTDEEWWTVFHTPEEAGIYWYSFEFDSGSGKQQIKNAGNGIGSISNGGSQWQMTVYAKGYKTPEWLKGGIIYQIFPDRFCYSGDKKSGVPEDRIIRTDWSGEPMWEPDKNGKINKYDYFCGDLKGIEHKLGYLRELGVNCIYLNPIFEAHSNHRYDTADYMKIDPLLGSEEDFTSLCRAAEECGIRIILDGVFSHTGSDSVYFNAMGRYDNNGAYQSQESPYFKWYKFKKWPDDYVCWWGVDILPETNETEQSFADFITGENGVIRKWLRAGASGWRLDVADELPDSFLNSLNCAVKTEKPDAYILGEVWEDASNKISYGTRRKYLLGSQLDSVMNYPFALSIFKFLKTGETQGFMDSVMSIFENYPPQSIAVLMNHIGTHDTARALTRLAGAEKQSKKGLRYDGERLDKDKLQQAIRLMKVASAIQFTLPGVPCIYYGDEAGLEGGVDPFNRGCYPWGNENGELLEWYKSLGRIRRGSRALREGEFIPVSAALGCIAYARVDGDSKILLIANRNNHEIDYYLQDEWKGAVSLLGAEMKGDGCARIDACSAAILGIKQNLG